MSQQQTLNGDSGPTDKQLNWWFYSRDAYEITLTEAMKLWSTNVSIPQGKKEEDRWYDVLVDGEADIDVLIENRNRIISIEDIAHLMYHDFDTKEAIDYQGLDPDELPHKVIRACAPTDEWYDNLDASDVHMTECCTCDDELYRVMAKECGFISGDHDTYVDKRGEVRDAEHVSDASCYMWDTDPDTSGIMCEYCYEDMSHGAGGGQTGTIMIVDNGNKEVYDRCDTVVMMRDPYEHQMTYRHEGTLNTHMIEGLGWDNAMSGWHSSMERSDVSKKVNELTSGEVSFNFPILVEFKTTTNVCSMSINVLAAEEHIDELKDYLNGARGFGMRTN